MYRSVIVGLMLGCLGLVDYASAGKVDLILGLNQTTKTWKVFAKITNDDIAFETAIADPGDQILGIGLFDFDITATGDIDITTANVSAPVGTVAAVDVSGFKLNPFATHSGAHARVYAAQDTFADPAAMPTVVLEDVGIASGSDAFGASWGFPVVLASGTYSGTTGKLSVSDHPTGSGPGLTLLYGNTMDGFNDSQKVEFAETVAAHTVKVGTALGDINGDGKTDLVDFNILKTNFGLMGGRELGDLDGDAFITLADFSILKDDFGNMGPVVVPEPATIVLIVSGLGLGLVLLRRRRSV
jgi:hypothetical protein